MPWPWKPEESQSDPQPPPQSQADSGAVGASEGEAEFEKAAAEVSAPPPSPVVAEASPAPVASETEIDFTIHPAWARGAVKFCFAPLTRYDERWALTDTEAERARPQMQVVLQRVVDRYVPSLLARIASKHKELFDLVGALALIALYKGTEIYGQAAEEVEEAAASAASPEPKPPSTRYVVHHRGPTE